MDFSDFYSLFQSSTSEDQRLREASESRLSIVERDEPVNYILYLIQILNNDSTPPNFKMLALIYFKNYIVPSGNRNIQIIKETFNSFDPIMIKTDILSMLLYFSQTENNLRSLASITTALYIRIDNQAFVPILIDRFNEMCEQFSMDFFIVSGFFSILNEIFINFDKNELLRFQRLYTYKNLARTYIFVTTALTNTNFNDEMREILLTCIKMFYSRIKFNNMYPEFPENFDHINFFLESLFAVLPYCNENNFGLTHSILALITEKHYEIIDKYFETIFKIGNLSLEMSTLSFKCIAIDFWADIAIIEKKQIIYLQKYPHFKCQKLILNSSQEIVPKLINCFIIPDDPTEEVFDTCRKAVNTLSYVINLMPNEILSNIEENVNSWIDSENSRDNYAALMIIESITRSKQPVIFNDLIKSVIQKVLNFFNSSDELIRKTSISLVSMIVEEFQNVFENDNFLSLSFDFASQCLSVSMDYTASSLGLLGPVIKTANETYLNAQFEEIFNFLFSIMNNETLSNEVPVLYEAFTDFDYLISRTCFTFFNLHIRALEVLITGINSILSSMQDKPEEGIPEKKLQLMCLSIQTILRNTPRDIINYEALINNIFDIYHNYNISLRCDIFLVIESIIESDNKNVFVKYVDAFVSFVNDALDSQIPDLIGAATQAFGAYLSVMKDDALQNGATFEKILNILKNDATPEYPEVYSRMVLCVGKLIGAIRPKIPQLVFSSITEFLTAFLQFKVEGRYRENYIEVLPSMLYTLIEVYRTTPVPIEPSFISWTKEILFKKFVQYLWDSSIFNDEILMLLMELFDKIISCLGGNIGVSFKLQFVQSLFREACSSFDEKLTRKASLVEDKI